jgi:hypothetical protein
LNAYYGGCDPGANPGYACVCEGYLPCLATTPIRMPRPYAVLAIEGQYLAGKRGARHKGRKVDVGHLTVPTLAFCAGRQSILAGAADRVLRCAPEVWRTLLGMGGLSASVCINHLRRRLGTAEHTDDAVEAYGLALVAQLIGPTATKGAGWKLVKQDAFGWYDVKLVKAKVKAL